MESCNIYPFVSGFFHLAKKSSDASMAHHVSKWYFFLSWIRFHCMEIPHRLSSHALMDIACLFLALLHQEHGVSFRNLCSLIPIIRLPDFTNRNTDFKVGLQILMACFRISMPYAIFETDLLRKWFVVHPKFKFKRVSYILPSSPRVHLQWNHRPGDSCLLGTLSCQNSWF